MGVLKAAAVVHIPNATALAQIPRAQAPEWWGRNWTEIVTAIQEHQIADAIVQPWAGFQTLQAPEGFAWLREVDGRGFLFSQGW